MQIKESNRLFYRTFPFKAVLWPEWVTTARHFFKEDIPCRHAKQDNKDNISKMKKFLASYPKDQLKTRVESGFLTLFFKEKKILKELQTIWPTIVSSFFEPKNEIVLEAILANSCIEIKENLVHGCRFKIKVRDRISILSENNIISFINLIEKNKEQFVVTTPFITSLKKRKRYFYSSSTYFYVRDSKFLLLTQMLLQPIIQQTIKIVTYKELEQENTLSE